MLLTLSTTHRPASDLGYLLAKHPAKFQSFELAFGTAHVFYAEASEERCEVALLLEVDPVGLVRGRTAGAEGLLDQYVNDRPYAASSFLSVAIAQVFGSALGGRSKGRRELAETAIPLEARRLPLDETFPEWGESPYLDVTLRRTATLREFLTHLYVLVPVLDDEKHYYVGADEVEKLLRFGEGWLASHPERDAITRRYLKHSFRLTREALARLVSDEAEDPDADEGRRDREEEVVEERISLNQERTGTVLAALKGLGARRVLDLGCGDGKLLARLFDDRSFEEVVGVDVSCRALEVAARRLHQERLPERQRARIRLLQGALNYRDARLAGFDAAAVVEVIEHLEPGRLDAFARSVFEFARPGAVVLTTPNAEFNVEFEGLPAGKLRHRDHRFEWTRGEFAAWCGAKADRFGYAVRFAPIGTDGSEVGPPTQMAVFTRAGA